MRVSILEASWKKYIKNLSAYLQKMVKTITFDQGCEFADHQYIENKMDCDVYYCETHSPWQKGSNENMNG